MVIEPSCAYSPAPYKALLPVILLLFTTKTAAVLNPENTAAPCPEILLEITELVIEVVPLLRKAPPSAVVLTPEIVTPEIDRLPPVSMEKAPKLRVETLLSPLMVSEEAPRPVMVRVPMVPPEIAVLAFNIVGRAEPNVMVYGLVPEAKAKSMMSLPAVVLAKVIAARREPAPVSALVVTEKVEGVILSSRLRRLRTSSLRGLPLTVGFLVKSRFKILRKNLNAMV
jgi:hypothetical protein